MKPNISTARDCWAATLAPSASGLGHDPRGGQASACADFWHTLRMRIKVSYDNVACRYGEELAGAGIMVSLSTVVFISMLPWTYVYKCGCPFGVPWEAY